MFKKLNLFSKTEMRILAFIANKDGELYERQIAKEVGVSVGSANAILNRFTKMWLVKKSKKGKMSFYERNDENPVLRQFKVFITVNNLLPFLEKITPLSKRVVLFGSCAEGRNGERSDIDLFILSKEKEKIRGIAENYPTIQEIILDSGEYARMQEKDKPLYARINAGVELYGGDGG